MSITTFITYAIDKRSAQKEKWRTKESTLHLMSLFCGWPGAFYGQTILRHKSSKRAFKNKFWFTVFMNVGLLIGCFVYVYWFEVLLFNQWVQSFFN